MSVDTPGALVDLNYTRRACAVEAAKPFVFGDWGPTEQQYRFGAECYSVTVDAMLKLLPQKAFTYFFQPGVIDYTTITPLSVDRLNNKTLNAKTFIQPGLKPNKVLTKINVESQQYGYSTTSHNTKIYGSEYDTVSQPVVTFDANGFVTSIAPNKRLYNIDDEAVLKSNVLKKIIDPTDPLMKREIKNIELEYIYSEAEYVANGVSQALYNYAYRNNYTVDLNTTYNKLDTHLIQKANGFTKKDMVNFFAESSFIGSYGVSDKDYNIVMHRGYPHTFINACGSNPKRCTGLSNLW